MNNKFLNQNIDRLDISCDAINILKENKIKTIKELCVNSKTALRNFGLTNQEINKAEIELQLLGLNLKTNY